MKTPLPYLSGAVAAFFLSVGLVHGGTNIVTSGADDGPGSLRFAVQQSLPGDFIVFAINGTVFLTSGEILISKDLSIIGNDPANQAISGINGYRIFSITSGVSVVIAHLTLRDGRTPNGTNGTNGAPSGPNTNGGTGESSNPGGAIVNLGALSLTNCHLISNRTGNGGKGGAGGGTFTSSGEGGLGGSSGNGGAIYNVGTLILSRCVLSSNRTGQTGDGGDSRSIYGVAGLFAGKGGAVYNGGTSIVVQCTFNANVAGNGGSGGVGAGGGGGGAIYNNGALSIVDSTLSANVAGNGGSSLENAFGGVGGSGGGLFNGGSCTGTNCTFDGNRSGNGGNRGGFSPSAGTGGDGGGVFAGSTFVSCNSTFIRNVTGKGGSHVAIPGSEVPPGRGGGIHGSGATLFNSLIASNSSVPNSSYYALTDVYGTFTSSGNNLVSVTNGSTGFTNGTDLCGSLANPLAAGIGPLAANGGPTMTCALLAGSPAIDAGGNTPTSTDQRGFPRQSGLAVDIGAFEVQTPSGPPRMTGLFASNGLFKFAFTNRPGALFAVLSSTNIALPRTNWTLLGQATENSAGQFQFSDTTTNNQHRFYLLRSP